MSVIPNSASWQVPAYDVCDLEEKQTEYCVCVFVINEGEKIQSQLRKMSGLAQTIDVIIADGGSTDGSLAHDFLRRQNVRALLVKTGAGHLSSQMRMAFDFALKQGYQGIITIDGNNKDDPTAITEFAKMLDQGFDHVQGSRYVPGGVAKNTPMARLLGVRLLHAPLISLSSGVRYTDTTNGFRAYSRRFLLDPRVKPFRQVFVKYELHYYLAVRAGKLDFRVAELPVTRRYPKTGKTPTKISPVRGHAQILWALFKACAGRYDPEQNIDTERK